MQKVTILCTGKLKEKFYLDAVAEYVKRLSRFCKLEIIELPEERLPAVLRLWVLRFWPCFVLWRAGSCAAVFSSGARLDAIGSFAPQRAR